MRRKRAVFLDRDGVINRTFLKDGKARAPDRLEDFEFLPGVKEAINELKQAGFLTIVVTNQPDVARGLQTKEVVDSMNEKVAHDLAIDDLKVCFHTDEHGCQCRKPNSGMLLEAASAWDIDLSLSYMIGDRYSDIQAGNQAGCTSILVGPGDRLASERLEQLLPATQVKSLWEASRWILTHES
jgi:D-glycero-D-manno-heptose 1,7-bisphosphate phosphatase